MLELAGYTIVAVTILVVGVAVGMLVAPVLTRWTDRSEPDDEETGAGDR